MVRELPATSPWTPMEERQQVAAAQGQAAVSAIAGWSTGGTGGTGDLGWDSAAALQAIAEMTSSGFGPLVGSPPTSGHGAPADANSQDQGRVPEAWAQEDPPVQVSSRGRVRREASHTSEVAPGVQLAPGGSRASDEDVDFRLEAMVEDLAGVNSFSLLEDAFVKLDAAREALSKMLTTESTGLRKNAPTFVPGQAWTGEQQSSFVD